MGINEEEEKDYATTHNKRGIAGAAPSLRFSSLLFSFSSLSLKMLCDSRCEFLL